jgi:hypothetical protein
MNQQEALKLLEISANLASQAMHAKATAGDGPLTETELKNLFVACVDMVHEKYQALPTVEQDVNEKFATIGEMHRIFAEKIGDIERREEKFATIGEMHRIFADKFANLDHREEKFATIAEMHRIFAEKFAEIDKKLAAIPVPRPSRRPV